MRENQSQLKRYAHIEGNFAREFVLLQGTGCVWKQCTFCDYHLDTSSNPYQVNKEYLSLISGKFGRLDIINSGSAMELDAESLAHLQKIVIEKNIQEIWFEAHYLYRYKLADFAKLFPSTNVKFRCGVETFDPLLWKEWKKGIPQHTKAEDIAKYFQGVCLLICVQGQTKEQILKDIQIAQEYFEYASINLFCANLTKTRRDQKLVFWFTKEIYPQLKQNAQFEILIDNKDLGVG